MTRFRDKYRKIDVLIIDDIQFLANKDRSQEEFFHTFNTLFDSGKQIIVSADRPPHELKLIDDRLTSRFQSGMQVQVHMPDYQTRLEILHSKCREAQIFINQQVLEYIAEHSTSSVRALEGILTRALATYELEHTTPTLNTVAKLFDGLNSGDPQVGIIDSRAEKTRVVTLEALISTVANFYQIAKEDVIGDSRVHEYLLPRQIIMYLAKTKLRMSLSRIGHDLGNRNHTTVMNAISRIGTMLKEDRQLLRDLNAISGEAGIS
jgi:chromosomal replication initiator protein